MFFGSLYKILVQGSLSQTDSLSQTCMAPSYRWVTMVKCPYILVTILCLDHTFRLE